MHCCFMFSLLKQMDSSKSEVNTSVADYLEKEKLCQEICKTITESVESTNNVPITSLNTQPSMLLPELNSDQEIEAILQQISDCLGTQFGDNFPCTEDDGISDELSVEEILKEAERLVRASSPYFEKNRSLQINSSDPLPLVQNIKHLNSVKKLIQRNYFAKDHTQYEHKEERIKARCVEEKNKLQKEAVEDNFRHTPNINNNNNNINTSATNNNNNNNINSNNNKTQTDEVKSASNELIINQHQETSSPTDVSNEGSIDQQLEIVQNELTLMDLQTVPPNSTYTVVKDGNKLCKSMTDINIHKQEDHRNEIAQLNKKISILTIRVSDYEKMEANVKRSENLATAERQRVKLLQDEIRSQEDLIESYQKENQRLSNDLLSAKL